jgi:FtsZ-binding cell division protein ZapB
VSEYAEFNDRVATFAPVRNLGAEVAELEAQRRQLQQDNAQLKAERDELDEVVTPIREAYTLWRQEIISLGLVPAASSLPQFAKSISRKFVTVSADEDADEDMYQEVQHAGV